MSMLKEFKEFAMKGNLVDIAVGFVMGAAFKQVVTSFTGGIVSPLIGLIFNANFKDLKIELKEAVVGTDGEVTQEAVYLLHGEFITNVIDFIIVAFYVLNCERHQQIEKEKRRGACSTSWSIRNRFTNGNQRFVKEINHNSIAPREQPLHQCLTKPPKLLGGFFWVIFQLTQSKFLKYTYSCVWLVEISYDLVQCQFFPS